MNIKSLLCVVLTVLPGMAYPAEQKKITEAITQNANKIIFGDLTVGLALAFMKIRAQDFDMAYMYPQLTQLAEKLDAEFKEQILFLATASMTQEKREKTEEMKKSTDVVIESINRIMQQFNKAQSPFLDIADHIGEYQTSEGIQTVDTLCLSKSLQLKEYFVVLDGFLPCVKALWNEGVYAGIDYGESYFSSMRDRLKTVDRVLKEAKYELRTAEKIDRDKKIEKLAVLDMSIFGTFFNFYYLYPEDTRWNVANIFPKLKEGAARLK